jgi:hypothetical protein
MIACGRSRLLEMFLSISKQADAERQKRQHLNICVIELMIRSQCGSEGEVESVGIPAL